MERLTDNNWGEYWLGSRNEGKAINKLGKLEDIEDELGIPLEVLFKALKDGIFFYHKHYGIQYCNFVYLCDGGYWRLSITNPRDDFESNLELGLEDYGKTWALTKEELEQ